MSNTFKWCGKIAPKASIPELVQNMCAFLSGDGIKTLINNTVKEYLEANPIKGFDVDKVFPVGSIYATENVDFDPVKEWGGSWEKLPELSLLRQAGESNPYITAWDGEKLTTSTYKAEAGKFNAGREKYALRGDNVPSHKHSYSERTYSGNTTLFKYSSGSAQRYIVTSVSSTVAPTRTTGPYPPTADPPSVIPIPLLETPTYGVIYWRRTA